MRVSELGLAWNLKRRRRQSRLSEAYCLDFSSQNPDINKIGELGGE